MRIRLTFLTAVFVILVLVTGGCGEQDEGLDISQEEKDEVIAVIEKNLEATKEEDIDAVSATMYQDHPEFEIAIAETKQLFEQFAL